MVQDIDFNGPTTIVGSLRAIKAAFEQLGWNMTPCNVIEAEMEEPRLGLATTRELLDELQARAEIHGYADYKTVS